MTSDKVDKLITKMMVTNNSLISHIYREDNTVKFDYMSVLNNVICKCSLDDCMLKVGINNDNFLGTIRDEDVINGIIHLDQSLEYLRRLNNDEIKVDIDDNRYILIEIHENNEIDDMKRLHRLLGKLDRVLLNCLYQKY